MRFRLLYKWNTRVGTFYIGQAEDGRYYPIFNNQQLGPYRHAWQASEDLANNSTYSAPGLRSTAGLGIPDHVSEWERV